MTSRIGVRAQDVRSSALWGRGGRTKAALLAFVVVALALPASGVAGGAAKPSGALVPDSLLAQATANPSQIFHVIVQGSKGNSTKTVASDVQSTTKNGKLKRKFLSLSGVSADLTGSDVLKLAKNPHVLAITPDVPLQATAYEDSTMWATSADVAPLWSNVDPVTGANLGPAPQTPTVAVVDSGIDATKVADFGSRIVANLNFSSTSSGTADGEGHGTMVAGVLAGSSPLHQGSAPKSNIVSLRTADSNGMSLESDVIAAADWILQNRQTYNIRVANFSLAGASPTSFRFDPLDKAVESLWFSGVVVVAAAGNYGSASGPVDMSFAPGNDPFIITVGALDQNGTADPYDDTVPYWSAYGYTMDGFQKPDVAAPGRYMVAPVPMTSTLATTAPDRIVAPGYMWMSGTSFAAPVVAGAAAQILGRHPDWTPDQVKGALMLTSNYLWAAPGSGVGEIDAAAAASLPFTPPNPNENFYPFVQTDPTTGVPAFDQASWVEAVKNDASWSSASWASASWAEASWAEASWAEASWAEASWNEAVGSQMASTASWTEGTMLP